MGIKITRSWLDQCVDTNISNQEVGDILTSAGIELDEIIDLKPDVSGVVTGYVKSVSQHPNADRLKVCEVAISDTDVKTIVCGCSTVDAGIHVAVATIGASLPGNFKIKRSKLRGVESEGMLCSMKELGLAAESNGIMHLENVTKLGVDIVSHLNLDDVVFDFDVTPNRGDCLSLRGLARELVAFGDAHNKDIIPVDSINPEGTMPFNVNVIAQNEAPRYFGAYISNINTKAKNPSFVTDILTKIEAGFVATPVDIANYLMFESGQPFHVFDADLIQGDISVRYAKTGEKITTLLGDTLELDESVLVIADSVKILAIAGIIGAENVAVSENTKNIFIESAYFKPEVIAKTCRKYNLSSDSAYRFERGIDYDLAKQMRNKLVSYLQDTVGGKLEGLVDCDYFDFKSDQVHLTLSYVEQTLGIKFNQQEVEDCLTKIGSKFSYKDNSWYIMAPSWRSDLNIAVDYVEELLRFRGYDNLPHHKLKVENNPKHHSTSNIDEVRDILVSNDFREVINYSFISEDDFANYAEPSSALKLLNPISSNMSYMRENIIAGLVKCASYNFKRQKTDLKIFEVGQTFNKEGKSINKIAFLALGEIFSNNWQDKPRRANFYDVKGLIDSLLNDFKIKASYESATKTGLHPGRCAHIIVDGVSVGVIAALHPNVAKLYDIPEDTYVCEVDASIFALGAKIAYKPYSRFPGIRRDLSLLIEDSTPYSDLYSVLTKLLKDIKLFDVYADDKMKKGQKSLAISLYFQDHTKTLQDSEVKTLIDSITKNLEKLNIHVRV
jgi:phenylalanyl-tRNA synthetase beta chain